MPMIGFVDLGSAVASAHFAAAFRNGLNETGYSDGKNVTVEYHWLEGRYDRLPARIGAFSSANSGTPPHRAAYTRFLWTRSRAPRA
jgi:hypothetical protein